MTCRAILATAAVVALALLGARPAQAQTAADINRLNQAMQICNSPLAAGVPECAQLRGQLGGLGAAGALAGALAGQQRQQQQPQPYNPLNTAAAQQAYLACVQRSGGNQMIVNACNAALQAQMASGAGGYSGVPNYGVGNVPPPPAPARPAAPYDPFAPPPPNGR